MYLITIDHSANCNCHNTGIVHTLHYVFMYSLYSVYSSLYCTSVQLSLASLWPIMLVETVSPATDRGGDRSDVDPRSSVMFLLEQFTTWLTNSEKLSSIVKAEIIKSVSYVYVYF